VAGDLFIADGAANRVYKLTPDGTLTVAAGSGQLDSLGRGLFSGDGGPAVQAGLNTPAGLATDAKGNLFIADKNNHRVRRIGPDGAITTIAGNPPVVVQGPFTYVQAGFSGDGGPATDAQLSLPSDVAVDGTGNVY